MEDKQHLLVQAGTGTGKSLAYLVPALLHRDRVVVATATLALQHQLVERDIPALLEAAGDVLEGGRQLRRAQGPLQLRLPAPGPRGRARRPGHPRRPARGLDRRRGRARCASGSRRRPRTAAPASATTRPGTPTGSGGRSASATASASAPAKCPYGAECFAERARERACAPSWSSPTTRCSRSTPSRASR